MTTKKKEPLPLDTVAWLADAELRCLEPSARGCLVDLMCYAHQGEPYGHVTVSGKPMTDDMLARLLQLDKKHWADIKRCLVESHRIDIAEHTNCIFIKRMVRDHEQRMLATEGGKRGGNPNIIQQDDKQERQKAITAGVYWNKLPLHLQTPEMRDAVNEWHEYRTRRKICLTRQSMARQINQLSQLSPEQAVVWIQTAIDKNWRSLYPPPNTTTISKQVQKPTKKTEYEQNEIKPRIIR